MTQNVQMEENISTLMDDGHTALEKGPSVRHPHIQWSDLHAAWRKIVGAVNPGSGLTIWSEEEVLAYKDHLTKIIGFYEKKLKVVWFSKSTKVTSSPHFKGEFFLRGCTFS